MMEKIKIFLADDHAILRQGLKLMIDAQEDMQVIGEAEHGIAALKLIPLLKPNVVVIDVSMPEMSGLEVTQQLNQMLPEIKIIALTRHNDGHYVQQLLHAGASGYALKQSEGRDLIRAIRVVATGGTYLDPAIAGKLVGTLIGRVSKRKINKAGILSEREADVLRLIARGHSNKEIANCFAISVKTVETHKANAMLKLELKTRADIVRYAMAQGWLQDD
ncbi:MAG TPA: response regulator transcription factor [Blastocatellia bacterium]|nr:response regulator transcription factor [Blastocatellia bacterium]